MRMTLLRAPRERKIYYLWVSEMCGERGAESLDFFSESPRSCRFYGCVSFIAFDSSSLEDIKRGDNPCDDSKQIRIETPK